jgi:hypothetical protein
MKEPSTRCDAEMPQLVIWAAGAFAKASAKARSPPTATLWCGLGGPTPKRAGRRTGATVKRKQTLKRQIHPIGIVQEPPSRRRMTPPVQHGGRVTVLHST